MNPYSLHNRLNDKQFDNLTPEQYLAKLQVVADAEAPAVERKLAKEDLLNAHLRLIAGTINGILNVARAKGGNVGIGIDGPSDLFDSLAGYVYGEMTDMAVAAAEDGFKLSSAIAHRVTMRIFDKIRKAKAAKRTAEFDSADQLGQLAAASEPSSVLEALLVDEAYAELRAAAIELPGTQGLVFQALIYGIETEQDLTIADVARVLGIPETTARTAYHAARKTLQGRYSDLAQGEAQ